MRLTLLAPLRHRTFALLFSGQVISDLGDWLNILALITLIAYRWQLGPGALAALTIAMALPHAVVGPFAGVFVDRLPHKPVMISSDLARALVTLGLFFAPDLPTLLVLVFLKEVFSTFFGPAKQATLASTVPEEDLLAANSLSQLSVQVGKVIGPVIGGLVVAVGGPRATFLTDAFTFLASAAFLSALPRLARAAEAAEAGESGGFWGEFRAGLAYIVRHVTLAVAIASMTTALALIFTFDSLGALALQALGVGESLLGLAVGAIGLGTALGAIAIGQFGQRIPPLRIMGGGQIASGILVALIGLAILAHANGAGLAFIPVWLLIGLAGAAMFVPFGFVLQTETSPEFLGRVFSATNGLQTIFQLLAPVVGALLADWLGLGPVFAGAGVLLALLGIAVVLIRTPPAGVLAGAPVGEATEIAIDTARLAAVPLFAGMSDADRAALAARGEAARFAPGEDIVRQGEAAERLFVVAEGEVEVLAQNPLGAPRRVEVLGPGHYFGEMALLGDDAALRTATVRALAPSVVYSFSRDDFRDLLAAQPELAKAVARLAQVRRQRTLAILNAETGPTGAPSVYYLRPPTIVPR